MRRLLAFILVAALIIAVMPATAQAGSEAEIALGLASFAVFNQLFVRPFHHGAVHHGHFHAPSGGVYNHRPVYAVPRQLVVVPPAPPPPQPTVIHYPHGRYELRGDGVTTAYQWVWIPNPPPPPPAPPPPTR